MTKADVVDRIASATGLTKIETEAVVDGFLVTIEQALSSGDSVHLRGFGSFQTKKRGERMVRNPKTGEQLHMNERYVPVFKASREFNRSIDAAHQK